MAPVTLTPYASASRGPCIPGKAGSRAGWVLIVRPPNRGQEVRPDQLHEAGADHQVRLVRRDPVGQLARPRPPGRARRRSGWTNVATPARRPVQPEDARPVGADGHDPGAVRRVGAGVEQGLQQGAGAGDEDDQPRRGGRGPVTGVVRGGVGHGGHPTETATATERSPGLLGLVDDLGPLDVVGVGVGVVGPSRRPGAAGGARPRAPPR